MQFPGKNKILYNIARYLQKTNMSNQNLIPYMCQVCGYMFDPEKGDSDNGIQMGIPFDKLSSDFSCPWCGGSKEMFTPMADM